MVERRKIGLIYQYNENWIGGTYYIENLIASLNHLADADKPDLFIFTEQQLHFDNLKQRTGYPYLYKREVVKKLHFVEALCNKVSMKLTGKNVFPVFHQGIDLVFPATNEYCFKKEQIFLYWIPDFQEHYIPGFFTIAEISSRKKYQAEMVDRAQYIVFSSNSAKSHFNEIYLANKVQQFVLPFAVSHPPMEDCKDATVKYTLPRQFFICSNQFWKHKNHRIVLKAIALLKTNGIEISVVFTGKEYDSRNPDYFDELKQLVIDLDIEQNVFFLGFIDREEQLFLMKKATAVIQPSLFEGWSTVVEDAKGCKSYIIASGIDVHREQLVEYETKHFFSADSADELATLLVSAAGRKKLENYNYAVDITRFAHAFKNIYESILTAHL